MATDAHSSETLLSKHFGYSSVELEIRFLPAPIVIQGIPFPDQFIQMIHEHIIRD
jgi:hypothetical protein